MHFRVYLLCLCLGFGFQLYVSQNFILFKTFSMAQTNLLSKEDIERSLIAVTKKLRIKVPHFDNFALV